MPAPENCMHRIVRRTENEDGEPYWHCQHCGVEFTQIEATEPDPE